jgi:hypothetical protein
LKVGYLRFTQGMDISFLDGSAGTKAVELRLGILEGLVQLGHTPVILNDVPKGQGRFLAGGIIDGYDYGFLGKCSYSPTAVPELDLLLVEGSVDNIQFGLRQIQRFVEVLRQYGGPAVVYHHGDQNCSVPIGEIKRAVESGPADDPHKVLYRNVFQGIPWRPKQWSLWTPGDPDKLAGLTSARRGYHLIPDEQRRYIPLGYSRQFDAPREKWEHRADLVYVGAERNGTRRSRIEDIYCGKECWKCAATPLSRLLFGGWDNPLYGFDYRGFVPGFGLVYSLLPMAQATVAITDDWFVNQGMITTRVIQGPRAGLLTLADRRMKPNILHYLPEDNLVDTHEEVHEKIEWWKKQNGRQQKNFLEYQQERLQTWEEILAGVLM